MNIIFSATGINSDDKAPENANEAVTEEYGDFWHGPIDLEMLYRPDGGDDDDEEYGFGNIRPGQRVPNNSRYSQPKRKREEENLDEAGPSGWGQGYQPGPSNPQNNQDDNSDAESEFGLARFFKKPKKN